MNITIKDINREINPAYIQRGRDYLARDMVKNIQQHAEGRLIVATVKGSGRNNYTSHIHLEEGVDGVIDITGRCSCPVAFNCKHVAAVLLYQLANRQPEQIEMFDVPAKDWFEQLMSAMQSPVNKTSSSEMLLYFLDMKYYISGSQLRADVVITRQLKDNSYTSPRQFTGTASSTARYILEDDPQALLLLDKLKSAIANTSALLTGKSGAEALEILINTGRCHWRNEKTPALHRAGAIEGKLVWQYREDMTQVISSSELDEQTVLLPVNPLRYLNIETGACGLFESGLPQRLACVLVASPAVAPKDVERLREALQANFSDVLIPLPKAPAIRPASDVKPVPYLRLFNDDIDYGSFLGDARENCVAELVFEYRGQQVHPLDPDETILRQTDDGFELITRDMDAEGKAMDYLDDIGLISDEFMQDFSGALQFDPVHVTRTWLDFALEHREKLEDEGWRIEMSDDFSFQVTNAENWYADVDEPEEENSAGHEWFNLRLGVEIDGEKVNLLPFLVNLLDSLKGADAVAELRQRPDDYPLLLELDDGRLLHIPLLKVRHIIDTLVELYQPNVLDKTGSLQLSRYQSAQLLELENIETPLSWQGGQALREFGERLRNFEGIQTVAIPDTLKADLRDYQKTGLNWLQFLREYGLGGILADDMGLGKTVQTLAHFLIEKQQNRAMHPNLVVAPTSLMVNWRREIERFAPDLSVLVLQGPNRKQYFDLIEQHDIILTTYPLLSRDAETLLAQRWHVVALDEAQYIKNAKSKAAQIARQLSANHRLCLTGTPMENHLGELWSQFHFLMPGLLGDEKRFRRVFRTPIEKHQDSARQKQLRDRVAPFMLRREKSEVATELPPKTEILSEVELEGAQRDLYETIRVSMHSRVKQAISDRGIGGSQIIILDALLKLRQVCCHPQLLKKIPSAQKIKHSAKLDQLMEMVPEMVEEGRRILLFSQFTSMLAIIEKELTARDIRFVKLTGQTRDRETPIDEFQSGKVPVFIISLKAGGVGLNLTAADTVIHYDPWWNPAVENQATDRAHRIGQDKPVFVYKMITSGTVEEKITAMQAKKQALADALFSEGGKQAPLSKEDLQGLFAPLR